MTSPAAVVILPVGHVPVLYPSVSEPNHRSKGFGSIFFISVSYGSRMSKDPNTPQPPPKAAKPESLEDLVYVPSLVAGNKNIGRANPLLTIPLTVATWAACGAVAFLLAKHTQAGRDLVKKTVGIDLAELKEEAPPPPPPPPPAPAAPAAPVRQMTAAAQGIPYESYIQQGWSDAQLVQNGLMLA